MTSDVLQQGLMQRFAAGQLISFAKLIVDTAFQPIVEISSGAVFGYEALMRGHDRLGFPSPLELLDQAEQSGQLAQVEQMVSSRAIAKFASIGVDRQRVLFINLDTRLIGEHQWLLDALTQQLKLAGVPPSTVCFELSERFDNMQQNGFVEFVALLRSLGYKLAIDDFGAGHSEMKLLSEVPIDYLKIDRHFVSGLNHSARRRHVVRNIVNMAHALGARVVAEGVESEAELACCRGLGCDLVQGWYIGYPTPHIEELQATYQHVTTAGAPKWRLQSIDEILIRREIETLPALSEGDDLDVAFDLFKRNPQQTYFPVVNSFGAPVGIVLEQTLKYFIYQPYGRDLLRNRIYKRTVSSFMTAMPIVDLGSDAERLLDAFANVEGSECLILSRQMRYVGVLSAAALLRILNEKQLKTAQDQNPLTTLPGNGAIRDYVQGMVLDGDQSRYFCYCDFDFFKPFNDHYGFPRGDQAISLFAALMRRHFVGEGRFLGHVGGDDFFIGMTGISESEAEATLSALLSDFRREVALLYDEADRRAGFITGVDRAGSLRSHPMMRCSIAVLHLPTGHITSDVNRIGAHIAALKSEAKASHAGLVFAEFGALVRGTENAA
ncbi:MAG: EAL domain-containing protein [Ancalomicrobiaceae bacterium]|nr:EAL domain-containing protein [Ancalomicrobiaceae bacterium]